MKDYLEKFVNILIEYAPNVIGALLMLIIGLMVIKYLLKLVRKLMKVREVDETLQKFATNLLGWGLKIFLFIIVISKLGIETTSFAAVLAAAGLAIGLALQGALGNFAGGALIMMFRPFNVGDTIEAQGEKGTVEEIQIFTTVMKTFDNKTIYIPNGALSNGNIINISRKGFLRVSLTIGVSYDADIKHAKQVLLDTIKAIPEVLEDPEPTVNVSELADSSVNFFVFSWANLEDFWTVRAAVLENCKEALDKAGIEIPYPHQVEIHKEG